MQRSSAAAERVFSLLNASFISVEESSVFSYLTNDLVVLKCTIPQECYYTAEKILFMTSLWGIMGSFDEHNRRNLGHCSKAYISLIGRKRSIICQGLHVAI